MRARRRTAPAQSSSKNELRVGVASPEEESDPSPDPSSDDGVADEVDRGVEVDGVAEEVDRGLVVDGDEVDGVDRSLLLGVSESSEDPERSVPEVETYRDIVQPPYSGSSTNPSWVSPVEVVSPRSHTPTPPGPGRPPCGSVRGRPRGACEVLSGPTSRPPFDS